MAGRGHDHRGDPGHHRGGCSKPEYFRLDLDDEVEAEDNFFPEAAETSCAADRVWSGAVVEAPSAVDGVWPGTVKAATASLRLLLACPALLRVRPLWWSHWWSKAPPTKDGHGSLLGVRDWLGWPSGKNGCDCDPLGLSLPGRHAFQAMIALLVVVASPAVCRSTDVAALSDVRATLVKAWLAVRAPSLKPFGLAAGLLAAAFLQIVTANTVNWCRLRMHLAAGALRYLLPPALPLSSSWKRA